MTARHPLTALLALLLGLSVLTGCASGDVVGPAISVEEAADECGEPGPLGIVVSPHANAPGLAIDPQMHCLLRAAVQAELPVAIVKVDGVPDLLVDEVLPLDNANDTVRADSLDAAIHGTVATALAEARPDEDGADLLAAVDLAAEALRSHGVTGGRLLVTTPGLPDTGLLDLTLPGMLLADPTEVATSIHRQSQLDLAPFTVVLRGVGVTSPPQEQMTPADRIKVVALLTNLFERAGARVEAVPLPSTEPSVDTEHTVTATLLPERSAPVVAQPDEPIVLDQSRLEFGINSDNLVDREDAARSMKPICQWLSEDGSRTATFTGTTATAGTRDGRRALSERRAAVAAALCSSYGVALHRIEIVGAGTDHPAHVDDLDAQGRLLPDRAALNRTVIVQLHG